MSLNMKAGQYTGTGSSINIELGFTPEVVIIINYTDGNNVVFYDANMTSGSSVDMAAAAASNASGSVAPYAGSTTASKGFATGADNSTSAKVYSYWAFGNV